MKQKTIVIFLLLILSSFAAPTVVITEVEDEDTIKIETGDFDSDYLYLGKGLKFSGRSEDLFFLGEKLDFSGTTNRGLLAGGQTLKLSGTTENGIISGSQSLDISGTVNGTSFIGAKRLIIRKDAEINGDLFVGSSEITIGGVVNGNLYLGAGKIEINSEINGDVTVYGGRIILGENGEINGDLSYSTKEKMNESEQKKVSGVITFKETESDAEEFPSELFATFKFLFTLYSILSFMVVGVILISLPIGRKMRAVPTKEIFWKTAGWGLVPIFMYPAIILISFIMGVTIPLALILLLAFVPLFYVARVIGATILGQVLIKRFGWNIKKRQYQFLIGAFIFGLLSFIPVIDFIMILLTSSLGWGVIVEGFFTRCENREQLQIEEK